MVICLEINQYCRQEKFGIKTLKKNPISVFFFRKSSRVRLIVLFLLIVDWPIFYWHDSLKEYKKRHLNLKKKTSFIKILKKRS